MVRIAASSSTTRIVARPALTAAVPSGGILAGAAVVAGSAIWRRSVVYQSLPIDFTSARGTGLSPGEPSQESSLPAAATAQGRNTRNTAPPVAGLSTSIQPS